MNTENLKSANDVVRHARGDREAQLLYLIEDMIDRIRQLEVRLDRLSDLTVGSDDQPFDEKVLEVLNVRCGSAREALDFERHVLAVIEDNSGSVYSHIEAEIEEKLDQQLGSYSFCEAVNEAIDENRLHDAIIDAVGDAEDIVRKGLRALI